MRLIDQNPIPDESSRFRAFAYSPSHYRVIVFGQDPYPNPSFATGLAFSVPSGTEPLPKGLQNIFRELSDDLNLPLRTDGDLSDWEKQGVLLLNRSLTTQAGSANSHFALGWEKFTEAVVQYLIANGNLQVAILWGKSAQSIAPQLTGLALIESPHPSPLAAYRGFFGSKPFSRTNQFLLDRGFAPIQWG